MITTSMFQLNSAMFPTQSEFLERATEQLTTPAFGDYVSFNIGKFHVKSMRKATFHLVLRDLITERLKLWNL